MNCCLKKKDVKKVHIETPKRPDTPIMNKSPSQHKRESSENLRIALQEYNQTHPPTLIIHSPKSGLETRRIYNFN